MHEEAATTTIDANLVDTVSAAVHEEWMSAKRAAGIATRILDTTGEELMVPYDRLSDEAKDLNRGAVRSTLAALTAAGYRVRKEE